MDKNEFEAVRKSVKRLLYPSVQKSEIATIELVNCIDEIVTTYQKYYDLGLEPNQISDALHTISISAMFKSRDFEKAAASFQKARSSCDSACKAVSEYHWPPVNKEKWPFSSKEWPAE